MNAKNAAADRLIALEKFRAWGRKGGKMLTRDQLSHAGTISARKRHADLPRCPTCMRALDEQTTETLSHKGIRPVTYRQLEAQLRQHTPMMNVGQKPKSKTQTHAIKTEH